MDVDLDDLKRKMEAATPGPWRVPEREGCIDPEQCILAGPGLFVGRATKDAAYIVAACNAVPHLLARIAELEAEKEAPNV